MTTIMARRAVRRTRARPTDSRVLGEVVGVATRARTSCERWRTPPAGGSSTSIRSLTRIRPARSPFWMAAVASSAAACAARSALVLRSGPNRMLAETFNDQPEAQRPLLDEPPHERPALPRGDVPVEVADVVTRLVRPQFGEREPDPRPGAVVRPGQLRDRVRPDPEPQPTRPPDDRRSIQGRGLRRGGPPLERPDPHPSDPFFRPGTARPISFIRT